MRWLIVILCKCQFIFEVWNEVNIVVSLNKDDSLSAKSLIGMSSVVPTLF